MSPERKGAVCEESLSRKKRKQLYLKSYEEEISWVRPRRESAEALCRLFCGIE